MIDKNYWLYLHFREGKPSDITCPTCGTGKIKILKKFTIHETRNKIELLQHGDYDTENLEDKFSGLLKCDNECSKNGNHDAQLSNVEIVRPRYEG